MKKYTTTDVKILMKQIKYLHHHHTKQTKSDRKQKYTLTITFKVCSVWFLTLYKTSSIVVFSLSRVIENYDER